MKMSGHLLYVDTTQICGIGCAFCMYADKHKQGVSMTLSGRARDNLSTLINSEGVKRISISGEGEPLNNIEVFHQILALSSGGNSFEFITSGFFPHELLTDFYDKTNSILSERGDVCNIRLSADSYHIDKIKSRPHAFSLSYWSDRRPSALTFSFRSVEVDREFTRDYLLSELEKRSIFGKVCSRGALEDELLIDDASFWIDYKNVVNPSEFTPNGFMNLYEYVQAIEGRIGKRFTLGSLNAAHLENGMDVTVKPSGDVYFYGVENICLGNIHSDVFDWDLLAERVVSTPLINSLYTRPFLELVENLSDIEVAQSLIQKVNNPYWLIKELARHDGLLDRMLSP